MRYLSLVAIAIAAWVGASDARAQRSPSSCEPPGKWSCTVAPCRCVGGVGDPDNTVKRSNSVQREGDYSAKVNKSSAKAGKNGYDESDSPAAAAPGAKKVNPAREKKN
jgi:hypothetical protein